MPTSLNAALDANERAAVVKADQATSSLPRFFVSSMFAGAFVGVAVLLLIMVSASMIEAKAPTTRLVQGAVFGIALTLVVFAGAELFTGNVMVMIQGWLRKVVTPADLATVWAGSLLGNLAGSILFAIVVNASGVMSAGAPKGKETLFIAALGGIVKTKASLAAGQLFMRSILCNFLVCLALWMATRTESDAAKLICLWWALMAFIASGFEHSIANMTIFSLGIFAHSPGATWAELSRNMVWTVPGNIIGGGLFVGAAYSYVGRRAHAAPAAQAAAAAPTDPIIELVETVAERIPTGAMASARPARPTGAPKRRTTTPPPRANGRH